MEDAASDTESGERLFTPSSTNSQNSVERPALDGRGKALTRTLIEPAEPAGAARLDATSPSTSSAHAGEQLTPHAKEFVPRHLDSGSADPRSALENKSTEFAEPSRPVGRGGYLNESGESSVAAERRGKLLALRVKKGEDRVCGFDGGGRGRTG